MVKLTDHNSFLARENRPPTLGREPSGAPWQKGHCGHPQGRRRVRRPDGQDVLDLLPSSLTNDPKRPVVCFTKAPPSSSAKRASRSRPHPDGSSASTTSIAATAPSISSSSSMPIALGAGFLAQRTYNLFGELGEPIAAPPTGWRRPARATMVAAVCGEPIGARPCGRATAACAGPRVSSGAKIEEI